MCMLKNFVGVLKTNKNQTNIKYFAFMAMHVNVNDSKAKTLAVNLLKSGDVISIPTDTVYGLACDAVNITAIHKLYSIKCRNENKPLAICVAHVCDIEKWADVNHLPKDLLFSLLPGPVTLVLKCATKLNKSLCYAGKVGIRIPDYSFIRSVANDLNSPIALTSANVSNAQSSVNVNEFHELWGKLAAVFDGGNISDKNRGASTVIDLSEPGLYKILRGGIAYEQTVNIMNKFNLKLII